MRRTCWMAIVILPLFAQEHPAREGVTSRGLEKEAALGRRLAMEVASTTEPLDSDTVRDYVNALGARVAAAFSRPGFTYSFIVVRRGNTAEEPLALPGGIIFVPASLLLAAQDEAEFAGMMAHALAHATLQDSTVRPRLNSAPIVRTTSLGGWTGPETAAVPAGFLEVQRERELEADRLAGKAMAGAGFEPLALARYIARLPAHDQRVAALQSMAQGLSVQARPAAGSDFSSIQQEVRRLIPAPAEKRQPTLRQ